MRIGMMVGLLVGLSAATGSNLYAADAQKGKAVFDQWCSGCHAPLAQRTFQAVTNAYTLEQRSNVARQRTAGAYIGQPPAGTYILELRYKDKIPAALEERTDLAPA